MEYDYMLQVYIHYMLSKIDTHDQGTTTHRSNNNCLQHLGWTGCDISHPGNQVKELTNTLISPKDCELVVDVVEESAEKPPQTPN